VHEERAGDLAGGQAAHDPQGERDLGCPGQRRVAAGEDQPQPLIFGGLDWPLQLGQLGSVVVRAPEPVQGPAPGHGEQPCIGPVRDPFGGPVLQRGEHRVLDQVFRGREVAGDPHQRGGQLARVLPDHAGQLVM
jgi:hypothetical protein